MARERADPHAATGRSLRGLFLLWHRELLRIARVICLACKRLWEQLCKFFSWGSSCQYNFLHSVKNRCLDWRARLLQEINDITNFAHWQLLVHGWIFVGVHVHNHFLQTKRLGKHLFFFFSYSSTIQFVILSYMKQLGVTRAGAQVVYEAVKESRGLEHKPKLINLFPKIKVWI